MAQPTYGAPWDPLADVYGQQWVFEPLTSDPTGTEQGDHWLRVDLDSGDKLATLRWDHGSGVWDVPVFAVGSSGPNVEEVLRVQTPNGLGFVPLLDGSPAFQQVGFQHGGTRYGLHDLPYEIPDSGVLRYDFEDDSDTDSFVDSFENGNTGTNNGGTYSTTAKWGTYALSTDGVDDYATYPTVNETGPNTDWSVSLFFNPDSVPSSGNAGDQFMLWNSRAEYDYALVIGAGEDIQSGEVAFNSYSGNNNYLQSGQTVSAGSYGHIGTSHDGNGNYNIVTDGTIQDSSSLANPDSVSDTNQIAALLGESRFTDGIIDRFDIYDKQLSSTEWDNLASTGNISG